MKTLTRVLRVPMAIAALAGVLIAGPAAAAIAPAEPAQVTASATATAMPSATMEATPPPTAAPKPTITPVAPLRLGQERAGFTLAEVTGADDIVLRGPFPSYSVFFPLPEEWRMRQLTLNLEVSHSALLTHASALTLEANGSPVASLALTAANLGPRVWSVAVPAELLQGESLELRFVGLQRISEDVCVNIESPGNWVRIGASSELVFGYDLLEIDADLSRLPYPFVRHRSLTSDRSLLVIPDDATSAELIPALYVGAAFGSLATWRGLDLAAAGESDLTAEMKQTYDLILVGRTGRLPLSGDTAGRWPLRRGTGITLLDDHGQIVPAETGIVMIIPSPWNPARAVLAVTGGSDAAVVRAARAVQLQDFSAVARQRYALIPADPVDTRGDDAWDATTLAGLGYSDQSAHGIGRHVLTYTLELPNSRVPESLDLSLLLSHSPGLRGDTSFVSILVNGIPQSGVYLTARNEDHGQWNTTIAADQIQPGRNKLEVLFDLHVADDEACDDTYYDQAWAVVHAASAVRVTFATGGMSPDLSDFPVPFDAGTIVVLPSPMQADERSAAVGLFAALGRELGVRAAGIDVLTPDEVGSERLQDSNAILLGQPAHNLWVAEALKSAPVRFDGSLRSLESELRGLTLKDSAHVGVAEVMPSPWNAARTLLVLSGTDGSAVRRATALVVDGQTRSDLAGDVALVDGDGRTTWLDSRAPDRAVRPLTEPPQRSFRILQLALIGVLAGVAIGLVVVLVRRQRQR